MPLSITIDGPVGAGKSSIAEDIAQKLGILHLDTGAMYRAFAYACKDIDINDIELVKKIISTTNIEVEFIDGIQHTYVNNVDVNDFIRTPQMSMNASSLSKLGFVREKLVAEQRKIAKTRDMVLDGRDTGTNVLKDAQVKIFLTASPETRAMRRFNQNLSEESYEDILKGVIARDFQDTNREINPLEMAKDAHLIDSSNMSFDEVSQKILEIVRQTNAN